MMTHSNYAHWLWAFTRHNTRLASFPSRNPDMVAWGSWMEVPWGSWTVVSWGSVFMCRALFLLAFGITLALAAAQPTLTLTSIKAVDVARASKDQ